MVKQPISPPDSHNQSVDPEKINLPRTSESEELKKIRHTTSHIMAMAVQKLFPQAQVTIGPWIENGFYYDFENSQPFTEKDLKAIYKQMVKIINRKLPVRREEVSREEAERRIKEINEPYKLEILEDIKDGLASASKYKNDNIRFKTPNTLMVFSNIFPNTKKLSRDRWEIYDMNDDELVNVSEQIINVDNTRK